MIVPRPFTYALMGDIEVLILAVLIRGDLVQCEVSWVLNGDRKTAWSNYQRSPTRKP